MTYKCIHYFLAVLATIAVSPLVAYGTVFVDEGFEATGFDRTPEAYCGPGYCNAGGSVCDVTQCVGCSGTPNVVTIQSQTFHTGSKALRGDFNGPATNGECGAAGFKILNDGAGYGPPLPNRFYVRMHIKWGTNLRFNDSGNKIMDIPFNAYFTGRSVDGRNGTRLSLGLYSSNQTAKTVCGSTVDDLATIDAKRNCDAGDGAGWIIDTANPAHTNGWWYFELMFDLANDRFSLWVQRPLDPTPTLIYNNMVWNFNPWAGEELVFGWWNFCDAVRGGGGTIYFDDVTISDIYIGPAGGTPDTTPPAAPTGLSVL